tara:strand:- start:1266 stop:1502 length:237 start_codon:yes stop_codon:yes gene_type:complete
MKKPNDFEDLKKFIREQEILTRRTILKNSRKNDLLSIRKQLSYFTEKEKKEQYLRRKYPAVKKAYNNYQLTMHLADKK